MSALSFIAGVLAFTNTFSLITNAINATATNRDVVTGVQLVYSFTANGTVKDTNGVPQTSITQSGIYSICGPDGWGYQSNIQISATTNVGVQSFVPGTLAYETVTNAQARTNGQDVRLFTTLDPAHTNFVRNASCWLAGIPQLTASVVAEGNPAPSSSQIGGSAVTPRHVINCAHAPYVSNSVLEFVDSTGAVITRTVIANTNFGYPGTDINVALLNADLPATVFPFQVLNSNYLAYLPCLTNGSGAPYAQVQAIGQNRLKYVFPKLWQGIGSSVQALSASAWCGTAMNVSISGGDSGHPIFILVGTNAALIGHWTSASGCNANYGVYFTQINTAMHWLSTNNGLSSDYQLTPANLSGFPTF